MCHLHFSLALYYNLNWDIPPLGANAWTEKVGLSGWGKRRIAIEPRTQHHYTSQRA